MKTLLSLFTSISIAFSSQNIDISIIGVKFNYKEYDTNNQVLDSESSNFDNLTGINLKYNSYYYGFEINYLRGVTYYKGATWGGTPLNNTEYNVQLLDQTIFIDSMLLENRINTNYGNLSLTSGLGYRKWDRGKSNSDGDYDETYYWPYYFIGLKSYNLFQNQYSIGIDLTYQEAINPKMKAYLGNGATYNLGNTYGYKLQIPFKYFLTQNYGYKISYTRNYWHINKSDVQVITLNGDKIATIEPESKTKNQFISFGMFYNF